MSANALAVLPSLALHLVVSEQGVQVINFEAGVVSTAG